ncbi:uncharacterized protein PFL1_04897 [Pseudozyma flocculosa PF-1]|uniref:DUF2470 domain-containing protein n=2 Tax=Pseudozyma flocculosa TaxID=84751 RepID=A0A5C3F3U0_9BASI|nr:uncharacterized protein PFL1_04897 [Pseudozyma flocculosa PF-1]EPQ27760.1 hypothetical protein PFL1_04897 [Pseudozyma flocculosa PF-1]SPO39098.1 uncharacterized protein PSFLO_04577 [Pseudozyma flocculosa]
MVSTRAQAATGPSDPSAPAAAVAGAGAGTGGSGAEEIAQKSAGVTSYMNNGHKESLAYLVTHHADLLKPLAASAVEMVSIDAKKVTLEYTPSAREGKKRIDVPFYPHLRSYDEVRPRFVQLCQISERVVKNRKPTVIYKAPKAGLSILFVLLGLYAALRSDTLASHPRFPSQFASEWSQARARLGGREGMDGFILTCVRAHVVEAVAMLFYASYKGASRLTALKWGVTQLLLGFPTFFAFRALNSTDKLQRRAVFGAGPEQRKEHH